MSGVLQVMLCWQVVFYFKYLARSSRSLEPTGAAE